MPPEEWRYGLHAGETETSMLLAMAPDLVQMDNAPQHYPDFPDTDTSLFFFGRVSVAWLAHDWSESGVYGDATRGTAEKGHALIEEGVRHLTKLLGVMSRFEVPSERGASRSWGGHMYFLPPNSPQLPSTPPSSLPTFNLPTTSLLPHFTHPRLFLMPLD